MNSCVEAPTRRERIVMLADRKGKTLTPTFYSAKFWMKIGVPFLWNRVMPGVGGTNSKIMNHPNAIRITQDPSQK